MIGIFIVIGGIDGCGGTTHSKLLHNWLKRVYRGSNILLTKEPSGGKVGVLLREYLKDKNSDAKTDALLFAADRSEHVEKIIKPALDNGKIVISDRYLESSLAYQCSQGLNLDWLLNINKDIINPDLTIILDIEPKESLKRKERLEDKFENINFLKKVREFYIEHAEKRNYIIIKSDRNIDSVQEDIRNEVKKLL